ncbi:sulfatase family protein [Rhodopirellula sp. JC639]|uniref:sulfatase family protein n=1 Tax=Stieleria mannarensis TaxID=2755585 RepID=UPI0015FF6C8D|nr:sulfatase [Rhodopirellula sp. JC639]
MNHPHLLIEVRTIVGLVVCLCGWSAVQPPSADAQTQRPNILIAISDDQSYPHASAYGDAAIKTPNFDRVARSGVLFHNAFTPAPGCSPMRAAFLTGREIWQIREAGTHASFFPTDLPVFTDQLAESGYHVGMTGKGWSPGKAVGWPHNPAGKAYSKRKLKSPQGISSNDYAANFDDFLDARGEDQPFCFWFGATEPHRVFGKGLGKQNGIDADAITVPEFLPDTPEVRNDIADYMYEIQWFDAHLGRMLDRLQRDGQLDNTLVIVTSDNGMSFPRAKANLYEYGIHMPLAICWPRRIPAGQDSEDLVSLIDVTRSLFAAAGVEPKQSDQMPGINLLPQYSDQTGSDQTGKVAPPRAAVFSGRERHSSSRFNTLGYPCRCIRTDTHLYIRNFAPERFPAGAAQKYSRAKYDDNAQLVDAELGPADGGYHDIDACPTLDWMIAHKNRPDVARLLDLSVALRPADELYDITKDPACMNNLAADPEFAMLRKRLSTQLENYLRQTGDVRVTDPEKADVWETYPRVSGLRWFPQPDWAREHPEQVPEQQWLDERRPK